MAVEGVIGRGVRNFTVAVCMLLLSVASQLVQAEPLTAAEVKTWMETRIATHRLQNQFRANAEAYDDVVVAFFQARDRYLQTVGYSRARFEDHERRIAEAHDYILEREDLAAQRRARQAELAKSRAAPDPALDPETQEVVAMMRQVGASEADIQKMLDSLRSVPDIVAQSNAVLDQADDQRYARVAPDIPAVEPKLAELTLLFDWLAGNRGTPPSL